MAATPAVAGSWNVAIEQNAMQTTCGGKSNIPVSGASDCTTAVSAAQALLNTLVNTPNCMAHCPAGQQAQQFTNSCTPDPYTRPNGSPAMRWQVNIKWACVAPPPCTYNQNLSTGSAPWLVDGLPVAAATPDSAWATLPGATWVKRASGGGPTYTYAIRFQVPQCAVANGPIFVHGSFAADNGASLQVDTQPQIPCTGNPNYCFKQANVTAVNVPITTAGVHVITIRVINQSGPTGMIAKLQIP